MISLRLIDFQFLILMDLPLPLDWLISNFTPIVTLSIRLLLHICTLRFLNFHWFLSPIFTPILLCCDEFPICLIQCSQSFALHSLSLDLLLSSCSSLCFLQIGSLLIPIRLFLLTFTLMCFSEFLIQLLANYWVDVGSSSYYT